MSYLKSLLEDAEVDWKILDDVSEIYGGLKGKSKNDFTNGNAKYISYKNIFNNIEVNFGILESVKVGSNENQHEVKYGDILFTGSSEIAAEAGMSSAVTNKNDEKVFLNSFSFGLRFNTDIDLLPEFSKYLFRSHFMRKEISKTASGVTRFNVSKKRFKKLQIPIPSLKIQKEIVRVLDTFTELTEGITEELTIELTARKKQYSYYREQLLTFDENEIQWKTLGEVAVIGTGFHDTKDAIDDGDYTFYARGRKPLKLNSYDFEETAIITAGDGAGVGKVYHWVTGKYALHQRAYRIVPNSNVNARFIYHYVVAYFFVYVEKASVSSSVTSLRKPMFLKFKIPIPSIEEQNRIVNILDKFDILTNSISEALPNEIELRKKQYEYYRNKLLTFPKDAVKE